MKWYNSDETHKEHENNGWNGAWEMPHRNRNMGLAKAKVRVGHNQNLKTTSRVDHVNKNCSHVHMPVSMEMWKY